MKIRIKYFNDAKRMQKIAKGNWIDVYANKDMFIPEGQRAMIPLGFALELPAGYEGHLAPRSSTFKTWGIIQTNSVGVVDDTYIGDNDQWHLPVFCLMAKDYADKVEDTYHELDESTEVKSERVKGTWIHKGDKVAQFRIMEVQPNFEFDEVESFGNADRGGFGSTGTK